MDNWPQSLLKFRWTSLLSLEHHNLINKTHDDEWHVRRVVPLDCGSRPPQDVLRDLHKNANDIVGVGLKGKLCSSVHRPARLVWLDPLLGQWPADEFLDEAAECLLPLRVLQAHHVAGHRKQCWAPNDCRPHGVRSSRHRKVCTDPAKRGGVVRLRTQKNRDLIRRRVPVGGLGDVTVMSLLRQCGFHLQVVDVDLGRRPCGHNWRLKLRG
mmetsp:Transcript_34220/g.91317  ORF Transcript_34220/g.91317 Transcript_34220/m.91317 type:complete len:211 (+) Transcript_34220:720-1352(+)